MKASQQELDVIPTEKGECTYVETTVPVVPTSSNDDVDDASDGHLHVRTCRSLIAINIIYFAQLVNLVGAGAVSLHHYAQSNTCSELIFVAASSDNRSPLRERQFGVDTWTHHHHNSHNRIYRLPGSRLRGRKWFLVVLTMFGGIGSLVVANAKSMGMVTGGFTIMDIAYGTQPLLHAVTSEVIPRRWRGWGQATNMISNSLGSTVGLIAGGALNRTNDPMSNGFRHFYYMVMGCFLLGAVICLFVYNPPKSERQALSTREKLSRLDWVGYFLLSSGLTLFCVALSLSQNPYTWADPRVSAPFAVGLGLLISLAVHETIIKKDGMFHHDLFTFAGNHNFAICIICVIAEGAAFFAANSYFVFQISVLYEPDSLLAGLRYTIMFLVAGLGAAFAGYLCAHTRQTRWLTVSAFMLFIVFFVCMVLTDRTTNRPVWGYPVIMGVALGITLTTLVTTAQISTPPRLIALASGLMLSSRAIDGAVGLACCTFFPQNAFARILVN